MSRKRGRGSLTEYGRMAERIVSAYGRAFLHQGDLEELGQFAHLVDQMEESLAVAVHALRDSADLSWGQIGAGIGMSGEGARKRFGGEAEVFEAGPVIYLLTSLNSGRTYVGQSRNLGLRVAQHRKGPVGRALGEFSVKVLERCETEADLWRAEKRWIAEYDDTNVNILMRPRRPGDGRRPARCEATELRDNHRKAKPTRPVRCILADGHEGEHQAHGMKFGLQKPMAEWTYYRYIARKG